MPLPAAIPASLRPRTALATTCLALLLASLTACGSGDHLPGAAAASPAPGAEKSPDAPASPQVLHQVGGTLTGLAPGYTVSLLNNGGDALSLEANGSFRFATGVSGPYAVTLDGNPPWHTCTVDQGAGTANGGVSSVAVNCAITAQVSTAVALSTPSALARDAAGNFYVGSGMLNTVSRLAPDGSLTTIATGLSLPNGLEVTPDGNLYLASGNSHDIQRLQGLPAGVFAGSGLQGDVDAQGTGASFAYPAGLASDADGNLYLADAGNHRIRKITPSGDVTTLAGSVQGFADGPATSALFFSPMDVAVDAAGNVYVAEANGHRIRKITPAGVVSTFAGQGTPGGDNGPGHTARFNQPTGLAFGPDGALYVAEGAGARIRRISSAGVVSTLAGTGSVGLGDGPALSAGFVSPKALAFDLQGNLLVADFGLHKVRKISN